MAVITAAVIAAGATVYAGSQNASAGKKQAKAQRAVYDKAASNPEAYFGSIPEPVDYTPLYQSDPGYANATGQVIAGNRRNLKAATRLSGDVNKAISAQALERIKGWDPTFVGAMSQLSNNRNSALAGYLPYQDALGITADRGRLANDLGMAGGSSPQIAADLGLSRLDLQSNVGPQLSQTIASIFGQVDPIGRHESPQNYLLYPNQAVPWMIQESQFAAGFQQSENAIAAMADPAKAGLLNLQAFNAGFAGSAQRGNAMIGTSIAQGASMIGGAYGGGGGGGGSAASMFSGSGGGMGGIMGGMMGGGGQQQQQAPAPQYYPVAGNTYQAPSAWYNSSYQSHNVSQRPAGI